MFEIFKRKEVPLDEEAVLSALETSETLVHNMIVRMPGLGLAADLSDSELVAVEAFAVGAFSVFLNAACNLDPNKPLPEEQGRRLLKYLAGKLMGSLRFAMLYENGSSGALAGMDSDKLVDRLIVSIRPGYDPLAFEMGAKSAHDLIAFYNGRAEEPDYYGLLRLVEERRTAVHQ